MVFGIYEEPMTPGQCNMVVERLGDYLIESGLWNPIMLSLYWEKTYLYIECDQIVLIVQLCITPYHVMDPWGCMIL